VDQEEVRSVRNAQIRRHKQPHPGQDCECDFERSGYDSRHGGQGQEYVAYDTHLPLIAGVRNE
jgi:hypothetical protein